MAIEFIEDDELLGDDSQQYEIVSPSGFVYSVKEKREQEFYNTLKDKILNDYEFTDPNDFADLDRILNLELMIFRMTNNLNAGIDESGLPLSPMDHSRMVKSLSDSANLLSKAKDNLGLSRTARMAENDGESVSQYISDLLDRAEAEGVRRNAQVNKALALFNEVYNVASTYLRSNEFERNQFGYPAAEDVLEWICNSVYPEYEEVDNAWRLENKVWAGKI